MSATKQTDSGQAIYSDDLVKAVAEDVPASEDHQNSGGKLRLLRLRVVVRSTSQGIWLGQAIHDLLRVVLVAYIQRPLNY